MEESRLRTEIRATLALAWPLALTNLSQMALVLTDTLYLGHLSTEALAASTLGSNLYWAALAIPFGLTFAAAAMLAQERGRVRRHVREMRRTVRQAFWGVAIASVPIMLLLWHAGAVLRALGQDPVLAGLAQAYMRTLMWGLLPFFGFVVLRGFLAAMERPKPALLVSFGAIGLNALLGWPLIFGAFGLPGLGLMGAGLASALSNLAMFLALALLIARDRQLRRFRLAGRFWRHDLRRLKDLFRTGLPIAGSMLMEIAVFSAAGMVMGWMGAVAVAAHAIALQFASAAFMVPMGIGQAATTRVGLAIGAGNARGAARAGWVAIAMSAGAMMVTGGLLLALHQSLSRLFLDMDNPGAAETAQVAATLVMIAGIFQIADGLQTTAAGALRGLRDTRLPMLIAALGYWGVALPAGLLLAFEAGFGATGIWAGLAIGLGVVAALMVLRWRVLARAGGLTRRRRLAPLAG